MVDMDEDDRPLLAGSGGEEEADPEAYPQFTASFDAFAQSRLTSEPSVAPPLSSDSRSVSVMPDIGQATAPSISVQGVPAQDAPRFINIPELPGASAKWASEPVAAIFKALLAASIFQIVWSVPLVLILIGFLSFVSSILGIAVASMYLCECCQSVMLEANAKMIRALAGIAAALDCVFLLFYSLGVLPALFDHDAHLSTSFILLVVMLCLCSHLYCCLQAVSKSQIIISLMHPVRTGTVLVV